MYFESLFIKCFNMQNQKLNCLKEKYNENCKTQSDNNSILLLYTYILQKENVDSDWWNEGYGCNDVVSILERNFGDLEWELLEIDLNNWTVVQIELFIQSIINGSPGYGLFEDIKSIDLLKRYTLEKRIRLLAKISKRDTSTIWNNIEMLKEFSFVPFQCINEIAINIGYYNYLSTDWKDSTEMNIMKELLEKSIK